MNAAQRGDELDDFDSLLEHTFDDRQVRLRERAAAARSADAIAACREEAWQLYRPVFAGWDRVERNLKNHLGPADIVEARKTVRSHPRFALFRHANFPDASRLLGKFYADGDRLERDLERNPGAPPAMFALYDRAPRARGPFPRADKTFIEALDHAAMRLADIDAVHQRTHAAIRVLTHRIRRTLAAGRDFSLLDVACGGSHLARLLISALAGTGAVAKADLRRIHILGVDVDSRSLAYTFKSSGLGWYAPELGASVDVFVGNLFDPRTQLDIRRWTTEHGIDAFDCVAALGILDYVGCRMPGEERVYIPEREAPAFGAALRSLVASGGVLIAAVFATEGYDEISNGARHLFANWQIEHATRAHMLERFPFLDLGDFHALTGWDPAFDRAVHFIVHDVA